MEEIDDFAGQALEFVIEIVGEEIDALMRALHPAADLDQMLGLFVAHLIQFGAKLAQQFFELLFE